MRKPLVALSLLASLLFVGVANAQELPEPPPPPQAPLVDTTSTQHTWVEARGGVREWTQRSTGFGPGFDLALGLGWQWIDVGVSGSYMGTDVDDGKGAMHLSQWSIAPEIATRTSIGGGTTFRLAFDPTYALQTYGGETHSLVGANMLAQILFTLDDSTRPVWRLGVGAHVGKLWNTDGNSSKDGGWIVGADVIIRSWW